MQANRFNLRALFLATTLISMGLGLAAAPFTTLFQHEIWYHVLLGQALWLGAGALVGTGLCFPINRPASGAIIGFVIQVLTYYTYVIPIGSLF